MTVWKELPRRYAGWRTRASVQISDSQTSPSAEKVPVTVHSF
jgi:hypothetical protein